MIPVRFAVEGDINELVRLRGVMFSGTGRGPAEPGPWQEATAATLRARLADGSMAGFVVPAADGTGLDSLAACALGLLERRFGNPRNPSGAVGYVLNVATDPTYRRRGYSRACMIALIDWFAERGIGRLDLVASEDAESLYASLGFQRVTEPLMSRRVMI